MSQKKLLKDFKIKAQRSILEDGLLDIMLGIYLILAGMFLMQKINFLYLLWLPIATTLIEVFRRKWIYPRVGYAKLKFSFLAIFGTLAAIVAGIALITISIALLASGLGYPAMANWRNLVSAGLIISTTIFFCFIAYRYRVPRWYFFGILMGVVFILGKAYHSPVLVIGLGLLILLTGIGVLVQFLQRHPIYTTTPGDDLSTTGREEVP